MRKIKISSRNKVFFPDSGLTKGDLINYYQGVANVMVPHMRYYGVSMQRFPDGIHGKGFFQKDSPDHFPDWITTALFPRKEGGSYSAPVADSEATLVYLADQAVITPHLYLSRTHDLKHPDRMIYDLDPPEGSGDSGDVRRAALDLRGVLKELDINPFVQTTGSKGYHLVVPLDRSLEFDAVRKFAMGTAKVLAARYPDRYTVELRRNRRRGRVFLDTLRNSYGATAVAPYGVRPLPGAPVATPLTWKELEDGASPRDWTVQNIPERMDTTEDPWRSIRRHGISLNSRNEKLGSLLRTEAGAKRGEA